MPALRRIIADPAEIRTAIHRKVLAALAAKFPIAGRRYTASVDHLRVEAAEYSHNRQKQALLGKGSLADGVYADVTVTDTQTGQVVGRLANHRIMSLPVFTNRYTLLVDGGEYLIPNQLRTKSGVFTRRRGNEALEAAFNLARGANFKLVMEPATGKFKVDILNATLPMFAVVKVLGALDGEIRAALGEKLYAVNSDVSPAAADRTLDTLYAKLAQYKSAFGATASRQEKQDAVRAYFARTSLNPETTKITLGAAHDHVGYQTILQAAAKILKVYNAAEDVDERDNLEFQTVHAVEDILGEVVAKAEGDVLKIKTKLNAFAPGPTPAETEAKLKDIFSPLYFSKPVKSFVTTSALARMPSQYNPLEMVDSAAIVTRLGEGAISSTRSVPFETRGVSYSYLGTIDPIATPESDKSGVDQRFTIAALKGDDGELYKEVRNTKTGKLERLRVIDLYDKTLGFPDPVHLAATRPGDMVAAVLRGKLVRVKRAALDYQIVSPHDMSTATVNTIPLVNASDAIRVVMGAKHLQQALPLVGRETRLVEAVMPSAQAASTVDKIGSFLLPKSPVDGVVAKIDADYVYVKDRDGGVHKVDYEHNLPLATKTLLRNDLTVKVGEPVQKGQALGGSNFTRDGKLALGRNLTVAYMPYLGLNHEDGIVASASAAKKMTSEHAEKVSLYLDKLKVLDKAKYALAFPTHFTKAQLAKCDEAGIAKKGQVLLPGDPVILAMSDDAKSRRNQVLGLLHKSLMTPYRDEAVLYEEEEPATVLEAVKSGQTVTVLLRIEKPLKQGDKLAGSYGNKGVTAAIIPDDQMPTDESGQPIDLLLTPVGVPGRMNPGQVLETALGKVAKKRGAPYKVESFAHPDYTAFVADELKKHGVKDKETVTDPVTGKQIPGVMVGVQYFHKLAKTTDTNFAARGIEGPYDQDEAPVGSGEAGPKSLGGMEVNALIAHNARGILRESTTLRASKNAEFWKSFQHGGTPRLPGEKKTFSKFTALLSQAGVKLDRQGDALVAAPLTDADVLKRSAGEIRGAHRLSAKTLEPEPGGLFDPVLTGGLKGTKWNHVTLAEPVVSPLFEDCAKTLLGLDSKGLKEMYLAKGGGAVKAALNTIDVAAALAQAEAALDDEKLKGDALDKAVKKVKYLQALKARGLKAGDAYTMSVVPVLPPVFRPISVGKTGDLMEADANYLYRDLVLQNESFKKVRAQDLGEAVIKENRADLADRVRELVGVVAPAAPQLAAKGVKGAVAYIAGDQPKYGFFQRKVVYSKLNNSGRATIAPDVTLGLDEVGLPVAMAWGIYKPFVIRRLTQMGFSAIAAREAVEEKTAAAKAALDAELKKRPVLVNRAPTLWRHSVLAAKPVLRAGKNLLVNSMWEAATNQDYDGDALNVHAVVTDDAIKDAEAMLPSRQIFTDKKANDLLMAPKAEPVVGLYKATLNVGKTAVGPVRKFKNVAAAWKAYYAGTLKMTDLVEIG